ncbi:hypothetical protein RclHR1_14780009 [Rhizophagus clarus]|uniref:Uncharacterized protein n=1 Tax=Rhizophagus clarus TaxID=94130 RepID=A0A2Z6QHV7_9GLOM|nr:hypothetical protein RclHR1_14780009 [Rhizophagus clarus]GES89259.1 hypothetical protein RCL_jg17178.t1 [Rhizophagus clarus]
MSLIRINSKHGFVTRIDLSQLITVLNSSDFRHLLQEYRSTQLATHIINFLISSSWHGRLKEWVAVQYEQFWYIDKKKQPIVRKHDSLSMLQLNISPALSTDDFDWIIHTPLWFAGYDITIFDLFNFSSVSNLLDSNGISSQPLDYQISISHLQSDDDM